MVRFTISRVLPILMALAISVQVTASVGIGNFSQHMIAGLSPIPSKNSHPSVLEAKSRKSAVATAVPKRSILTDLAIREEEREKESSTRVGNIMLRFSSSSTLVGHWKMDEGTGVVLQDASGFNNHASFVNAKDISWVPGVYGLAINMPGTTNRVAISPNQPSLNITSAISIAAWIRPVDMTARTILSKSSPDGYELSVTNKGKLQFRFNMDTNGKTYTLESRTTCPSNGATWVHVAATFNGTSIKLYFNGIEDAAITYSSPVAIKTNSSGLYIGAFGTTKRWKGALDEVRLYDGALTPQEISQLMANSPLPPATPVLVSPGNAALNVPVSPLLQWNAAQRALAYRVQLSESPLFATMIVDQAAITGTTVQAPVLQQGKVYYWRVHASNDGGNSDWSEVWSFTTVPPLPAVPLLAAPANAAVNVILEPTLSWGTTSGAASYRLQVAESTTFTLPVVDQGGIAATSQVLPSLQQGKTYYWRVQAVNVTGSSNWSTVWSFATVPPAQESNGALVHYWSFNNAADLLTPAQTLTGGTLSVDLGAGATLEAGTLNDFIGANARNNDLAASHLRINNPIGSTLTFQVSTVGFEKSLIKYETRRSTQGSEIQKVSYSVDGASYIALPEVRVVNGIPEVVTLDLRTVAAANNNANLKIRIQFEQGLGGITGNNRIDNLTLEGQALSTVNLPPTITGSIGFQQLVAGQAAGALSLSTVFADPENKPLTYTAVSSNPAVATVAVVGTSLQITSKKQGQTFIEVKASDGSLSSGPVTFRTLVYPEVHKVADGGFAFLRWDQNEPEGAFPANMLFLQSDLNDTELGTELLYPYSIPVADYATTDAANIGYPYRTTSRTRINGLGEEGTSFVNTGRGRDLGAALVAIDTRNVAGAKIRFKAATLVPNFRVYNIAVLYRVGATGTWAPVFTASEQPLVYQSKETAESTPETLEGFLPEVALGKENVQVLFKYYGTGVIREGGGARTQIRLDDIEVVSGTREGGQLPAQVQLALPPNGQQGTALLPTLSWSAVANATTYALQVAPNAAFTGTLLEKTILGQTSYKVEVPLAGSTTYHWRVRAINSAGQGAWSEIRTFTTGTGGSAYKLAVNEVMSSNSGTIADEDGSFEDWIEILNYGTTAINLEGFGLSDSNGNPYKWVFPAKVLGAGQYLLVWASNKNRVSPSLPLHTNFAISAQGEEVILTAPTGERVDEMPGVAIPPEVSRGRYPNGTGEYTFFKIPTPGAANTSGGFGEVVANASFSVSPGVYTSNVTVAITHPDPAATLRYTLDGSEPTAASPIYQTPLVMVDRSGEPNVLSMIPTNYIENSSRTWREPIGLVRKGTVLRVKAFKNNALASEVVTGTYLVLPGRQYTVPVVSMVTDRNNLFGFEKGIYVPGATYVTGNEETGNYNQLGDDWERPASFEIYGPNLAFQENLGIRINGDFTRRFPQKSLRLVARGEYGSSTMNFQAFQNYPYTSFKRLVLRNSGNDWGNTMFKDAAAHLLVRHILPTQNYRPTVVFINGEYWGIHNLRERTDKHYLARIYGVDPENIDLLTQQYTVQEGDDLHYKEMLHFLKTADLTQTANYESLKTRMDVDDFINYFSAEIYYGNRDWPQSNIDFWRAKVPYNPTAPKGQDGRWRWILYDVDQSFGDAPDFNSVSYVTALTNSDINQEWPNFILRSLLKNNDFKTTFINRLADHLNTAFTPERVNFVIDSLKVLIEPEMQEHSNRWTRPSSVSSWTKNVNDMKSFAAVRAGNVRQHLRQVFTLGNAVAINFNVSNSAHGSIQVNSLLINDKAVGVNKTQPYPWQATYFEGVPIKLKAEANAGYVFSYWQVNNQTFTTENLTVTPSPNMAVTAFFVPSNGASPVLLSPANASTGVAVSPTPLQWHALAGSISYRVQVSLASGFATTVYDQANITTTSANVAGLLHNTVYYWRVLAVGANGSSNWSEIWSFRTIPAVLPLPGVVTLKTPANGATEVVTSPTLTWNVATNASTYTVQVSGEAGFGTFVLNRENVTGTSQAVSNLAVNKTYYWRVKAQNSTGSSAWSAVWSFTTLPATSGSSLVGHWKLDEGSGNTLKDNSIYANHAVLQNPRDIFWVSGVQGLAISMPGTTDRFAIAPHHTSLDITGPLTISAWIRPLLVGTRTILSKSGTDGYEFSINNDGKIEFRFNYDSKGNLYRIVSKTSYPSDGATWSHVAVTFDGSTSRLYLNGVEDASLSYGAPVTINSNTSGLYLGALLGTRRWKGEMDDIRLYRGALNSSEIAGIYAPALSIATATSLERFAPQGTALVKMYPNPVAQKINLEFNQGHSGLVDFTIRDVLGKIYLHTARQIEKPQLEISLADTKMAPGVYFLKVTIDGRHQVFKFIKE